MNMPARLPRQPGIDLLRGIAIALVVMHHLAIRIPLPRTDAALLLPKWLLKGLVWYGYEAVFVFFVISGFLIAGRVIARQGSLAAIDARAFWSARAARILPGLLVLVAVLSGCHLAGVPEYVIGRAGQSLPRAILAALGLHLNWYEGMTGYLPAGWDVLWSLSIEEAFYLGLPLLALAVRREALLWVLLGALAVSLPWTRGAITDNEIWKEKAWLPGMSAIATGVLAALAAARRPLDGRPGWTRAAVAAGTAGLLAVVFGGSAVWKLLGEPEMLLLTGSAALLLLGIDAQGREARPWRWPGTALLRLGGRLSYEIYLSHMFVVWPVVWAFRALGGTLAQGWMAYPPALAGAWLLGWGVARGITQPLERRWRARAGLPATAPIIAA